MSSRPVWSTEGVPGQSRLFRETQSQREKRNPVMTACPSQRTAGIQFSAQRNTSGLLSLSPSLAAVQQMCQAHLSTLCFATTMALHHKGESIVSQDPRMCTQPCTARFSQARHPRPLRKLNSTQGSTADQVPRNSLWEEQSRDGVSVTLNPLFSAHNSFLRRSSVTLASSSACRMTEQTHVGCRTE